MAARTAARDTAAEIAFLTRALKAPALRESVPRLAERARTESWSHEEFLAACLQREVAARESHGGEGRIRAARFPARKSLEEFDFGHARGLRREVIAHLGTLDFAAAKENVIFLGPPGTGKTHLAIGLAIRACQAGHRVLFATAAQWVARLAEAHHAGRLQAELTRLGRYPLLVINEVGYIPFEPEAANLFFQLVSARYERASLIVTSNKPFGRWGETFGDEVVAAAMIDRLVHHAEVISPQRRLLPAQRQRPRPRPRGRRNRRLTVNMTMQGVNFQMPPGGQNSSAVDTSHDHADRAMRREQSVQLSIRPQLRGTSSRQMWTFGANDHARVAAKDDPGFAALPPGSKGTVAAREYTRSNRDGSITGAAMTSVPRTPC